MYYMDKCLRWLTGSLNYYQHFHLNIFPTAQCTIQIIIHRDRINRLVYAVEKQWMQNYLQQFPTSWFYLKFGSDVRTKLRNRKVIFILIFWLFFGTIDTILTHLEICKWNFNRMQQNNNLFEVTVKVFFVLSVFKWQERLM